MAIEKRFIHFKKFSDFNSKKLSANEANTQYTIGISGEIQNGSPDVLYQSYVWIKDTQQQWTHGQIYNGSTSLGNETDPIFSASPAANITEAKIQTWDNTHEFVQDLDGDISKLYTALRDKQDTISDLATIREGAAKGATAVQTYIVDFDILELESGEDIPNIRTDLLIEAIETHKLILIPFDKENPLMGYLPVTAYYEDYIYFSIAKGTLHIEANIRLDNNKIYANDISIFNLYEKQDKLISGENIKTINGESILGEGDIEIDANIQAVDTQETLDDVNTNNYVKYVAQTLSDYDKEQARKNIGIYNGKEPLHIEGTNITFVKATPMFSRYSYVAVNALTSLSIEYFYPNGYAQEEYSISFLTGSSCTVSLPADTY